MSMTTIQITDEQRDKLEKYLNDGEPVRNALDRLLGNEGGEMWTEQEIRDIVDRRLGNQMHELGGRR